MTPIQTASLIAILSLFTLIGMIRLFLRVTEIGKNQRNK
jgi:hypothetical protein